MTDTLFAQTDLEALIAAKEEREHLAVAAAIIDRAAETAPVSVDPDVADAMGAFVEDALSEEDALDSLFFPHGTEGEDGDE